GQRGQNETAFADFVLFVVAFVDFYDGRTVYHRNVEYPLDFDLLTLRTDDVELFGDGLLEVAVRGVSAGKQVVVQICVAPRPRAARRIRRSSVSVDIRADVRP